MNLTKFQACFSLSKSDAKLQQKTGTCKKKITKAPDMSIFNLLVLCVL